MFFFLIYSCATKYCGFSLMRCVKHSYCGLMWYNAIDIWVVSRENQHYGICVMCNVSTQICLRSPRRLIWADTFRLRGIEVYSNYYWNRESTGGEKCLSGLACTACLCWSGSILYAESSMLVFSRYDSFMWLYNGTETRFSFLVWSD